MASPTGAVDIPIPRGGRGVRGRSPGRSPGRCRPRHARAGRISRFGLPATAATPPTTPAPTRPASTTATATAFSPCPGRKKAGPRPPTVDPKDGPRPLQRGAQGPPNVDPKDPTTVGSTERAPPSWRPPTTSTRPRHR
jgi:hypothetical protein